MKIEKEITISCGFSRRTLEISVDISTEDIMQVLLERDDSPNMLPITLNRFGQFLEAITPTIIETKLNAAQRETIKKFLTEQAAKF